MRKLAPARVSYLDDFFFISYRVYMMTGSFNISLLSSLRNWRYCVGARLKFWRRSRVPKKGSRVKAVDYITTAPPPNLTRLLHSTTRYAN